MTNASTPSVFGTLIVALALSVNGGVTVAQEDAEEQQEVVQEEQQVADEERPVVLDEVVVTAQKRVQDQKEVPVSLTVLDTEKLEILTTAGVDIRFLSGRVPSLTIESSFGRFFPRFYMRGLGNTDFDYNASQPVSLVYDEVVLENPTIKGMPVWDLDRTEVLRGPQGTLFGRNTPAGIVKFDSKKPSQEKDGYVKFSYGTYDTTEFQAAIGGALSDTVSARVSLLYQGRSDWVDNDFTGENDAFEGYDNYAYRLQFLFEPNDQFRGLLNIHGWDLDGTARMFRANIIQPGTNNLVPDFRQDTVFLDGLNQQDIEAQGGVLKLDYDFGNVTLTSVTGYETLESFSRGDIDGGFGAVYAPPSGPGFIPFSAESADGVPDIEQITEELRLTSNNEGPFNWLAGLYFFDEDLKIDTFSYDSLAPGNPQTGYAIQEQQAESWAAFFSLDYQVNDDLDVKAGVRYTEDEKDFLADRPEPVFQPPLTRPITRSTSAENVSWDLSAVYSVNPEVNIYGRIATGFRAPTIQGRIMFAPDFEDGQNPATNGVSIADEEDILSVEVGLKSELGNRRVRFNLTPYWYEMNDQQLTAVGGQFNIATLLNSDKVEGYGFETDLQLAPTPEWLITLGLSNNSTEIKDPGLIIAPCGGGCTILDPLDDNGFVLLNGNSLPHAPEWIFNGFIDYRSTIGDGLFIGTVDWTYHDERQFFLYESAEFQADAFEVGLRLAYTFREAKYEAALYGRNIFDEEIIRGGIDFINLTGYTNDPAIWGLEFVARF
jgi:iron complex outermembrane receptor protein